VANILDTKKLYEKNFKIGKKNTRIDDKTTSYLTYSGKQPDESTLSNNGSLSQFIKGSHFEIGPGNNFKPTEMQHRYHEHSNPELARVSLSPEQKKYYKDSHFEISGDEPRVKRSIQAQALPAYQDATKSQITNSQAYRMRNGNF